MNFVASPVVSLTCAVDFSWQLRVAVYSFFFIVGSNTFMVLTKACLIVFELLLN